VWDTSTGQCLRTLVHEDNPAVANVCFSPNGRFVLAFSLDDSIRLWDYVAGSVKKTYQGHKNSGFSIGGCFAMITDADPIDEKMNGNNTRTRAFVVSASEDGDIVLWDVVSKEVVQRIAGAHNGVCFWVDVNGSTMVSSGQDGMIKVFKSVPRGGGDRGEVGIQKRANGLDGIHGESDVRYETAADDELQRQVEADAASPIQHVKEEQI
jgi:COMPASS component SWD3